jgi:hypothetical protein
MANNIGLCKVSKTENDISEFDEFMKDYLASKELHAPVKKAKKVGLIRPADPWEISNPPPALKQFSSSFKTLIKH